jgi:predicted nucleic acid-binding protein
LTVTPITALLDACVIYPAPLRDLLMHLAVKDVYRPRWTDAIHDEWIRSVLKRRPDLHRAQLERTRDLMNRNARDALVTGYEGLIEGLSLPDPDDRHVLAAAIHAGAEVIVTFNLADFPADAITVHGIEGRHPDDFCCGLLNTSLSAFLEAVRLQRISLKNPPRDVPEFLGTLQAIGLPGTAQRLRLFADSI